MCANRGVKAKDQKMTVKWNENANAEILNSKNKGVVETYVG